MATCLLIIAATALGFILYTLRAIMIPFAVAVFLMYLLQPMVNYLSKPPRRWCDKCCKRRGEQCCEGFFRVTKSRMYSEEVITMMEPQPRHPGRHRSRRHGEERFWPCLDTPVVPRWVAVIVAIAAALGLLTMVGVIVYASVMNLEAEVHKYETGAATMAARLNRWLAKFHYTVDEDVVPYITAKLKLLVPEILGAVLGCVQYGIFVVIFLIYLLISPVKPIPSGVWGQIDLHIRRYIRLKTSVCLIVGVSVGVVLWLLGVDMSYVFGLITFVFNFIPNIGPLIATFLPMPIVLFDPDLSVTCQVLAFVLPTLVHLIVGNFVEPKIFGESFELSPVVVLLSLAFWGSLWGIPGMILAVPLIVMLRIVCLHLDHPFAKAAVSVLEGNIFEAHLEEVVAPSQRSSWDAADLTATGGFSDVQEVMAGTGTGTPGKGDYGSTVAA